MCLIFLVGIYFYKLTDLDKTINMKYYFFILFVILFSHITFAEVACTEMGCHDGLYINVPNQYKWQPGKYRFVFVMDKAKINCTGSLPFKDCRDEHIKCDKPGIIITEIGCALPKIDHAFGSILTEIFPQKMQVTIYREKKKLLDQKMEINYQTVTPNGIKCEPKCKQATVDLKFH
jgi:hypothetical protein